MRKHYVQYSLQIGVVALGCFLTAYLKLMLGLSHGDVMPVWVMSGIALASVLLFGYKVFPGIWLGAALGFFFSGVSPWVSASLGTGQTCEAMLGAYLLLHFAGLENLFDRARNLFRFFALAILFSMVTPTYAALIQWGGKAMPGWPFPLGWFLWWLADLSGIIIVTPFIMTWIKQGKSSWKALRFTEYLIFLGLLLVTCQFVFSDRLTNNTSITYKYLLLPFFVWSAFRFSLLETVTTTTIISLLATLNLGEGGRPFAVATSYELWFSVQLFLNIVAMTGLTMSAMVAERIKIANDMARLERLNLMGEMAAGIAHEIRNPMTTVRGFLQMLGSRKENQEQKEYFDLMLDELDRANGIISEYLSLARNKKVDFQLKNINEIVQALYPLVLADAMNADKEVEVNLTEVPELDLDEKEIRQLILNLSRNGLEAMPPGKGLVIETYPDGKEVVLAIRDQGTGIPSHLIDKLGTPFFTTKENGTGLGLAVSYSIVAHHNATIKVESGPSGTTFYVLFKREKLKGKTA